MFNIGDSINCKLKDGSDIIIDIGGINLYGQGEVLFCIRNSFGDYEMNERSTNNGGFPKSKMLRHMDEILKLLPDDLQTVITSRHITQEFRGGKHETQVSVLSLKEAANIPFTGGFAPRVSATLLTFGLSARTATATTTTPATAMAFAPAS